jgi:hypothetical protein
VEYNRFLPRRLRMRNLPRASVFPAWDILLSRFLVLFLSFVVFVAAHRPHTIHSPPSDDRLRLTQSAGCPHLRVGALEHSVRSFHRAHCRASPVALEELSNRLHRRPGARGGHGHVDGRSVHDDLDSGETDALRRASEPACSSCTRHAARRFNRSAEGVRLRFPPL